VLKLMSSLFTFFNLFSGSLHVGTTGGRKFCVFPHQLSFLAGRSISVTWLITLGGGGGGGANRPLDFVKKF
jgi:hypothetical protein